MFAWLRTLRHHAARPRGHSVTPRRRVGNHILAHVETHTVLAVSEMPSVVCFLEKNTPETYAVLSTHYPHYRQGPFFARTQPDEYPMWIWRHGTRTFEPTQTGLSTDHLHTLSRLMVAKEAALIKIIWNLNLIRQKSSGGILLQDHINRDKRLQAQAFKDTGYDETRLLEFPYVLQYADYIGCSPALAADDILLETRMRDDHLVKTEYVRMRYFARVAKAVKPEEMEDIVADFIKESYVNARA